ncbi:hypothetical protein K491DRAFT_780483 [Lophiostoma macrostomum CBS 122681]|uniref:Uncharacterized protein n=1 Tax=Lophiostoma macrostomum CBS 122681 TaxID=1314788 RepID=A0A6A6SZP8_9PLEO|nr:hypothetical protein K491DRAFT_780483 [Lophiostoma macrostomum CBS 122681]
MANGTPVVRGLSAGPERRWGKVLTLSLADYSPCTAAKLPMDPTSATTSPTLQTLPPWAKQLLKRPLIEIRRGLSLDYDPPFENSSVIALTAPSGKYVDIRFRLAHKEESSVKKESEHFAGYATAGTATAILPIGSTTCEPYECTVHVKWEHPIDSSASFATDGADMYLLANGDTMEVGVMEIDSKIRMFKEYWTTPKHCESSDYVVVETPASKDDETKGMAIRMGNYCQGVLQTATDFWVERWELNNCDWTKDARSNTGQGDDILPCKWMVQDMRKVGDKTAIDAYTWEVIEASTS